MKRTKFFWRSIVSTLACAALIQPLIAAPVVFTINNSQSQIAASGTVAGATFSAQGTGALTTSYTGTINANVSGSTIQFTSGSTITAQNSGSWQPDVNSDPNAAPANYGPTAKLYSIITVNGALRNIVLDLNSPALNISGGTFDGSNLIFSSPSPDAVLDYYSSITSGSLALNGYATNAVATVATLSTSGGTQTLTIPIDATFYFTLLSDDDTSVHLTGQIVATSSAAAAAPIIHSLAISNQNVVVATENATAQSQLLVSTNLTAWSAASTTITTNNSGWIIFTTPMHGPRAFFRVQQ